MSDKVRYNSDRQLDIPSSCLSELYLSTNWKDHEYPWERHLGLNLVKGILTFDKR